MISPALRELIDARKSQFPPSLLDRLDLANPEVRTLPHWMAPPPPPEEKTWVVGQFAEAMPVLTPSKGIHLDPEVTQTLPRRSMFNGPVSPKANALRGKHPNRLEAPPCVHCGSENTWSKYKAANGKRRRQCMDCERGYTIG